MPYAFACIEGENAADPRMAGLIHDPSHASVGTALLEALLRLLVEEAGFAPVDPPVTMAISRQVRPVADVWIGQYGVQVTTAATLAGGVLISERRPPSLPAGWLDAAAGFGNQCALIVALGVDFVSADLVDQLRLAAGRRQLVTARARLHHS